MMNGGANDVAPWILVQKGGGLEHRLKEDMIFVGREECDVTVKSPSVDKRHAVLTLDAGDHKFKVKDLNSTNGTFVNDVRIPEQTYVALDHNDSLRFGFDSGVYHVQRVTPDKTSPSRSVASSTPGSPEQVSVDCERNGFSASPEVVDRSPRPSSIPVMPIDSIAEAFGAACRTPSDKAKTPNEVVVSDLTSSLSNTSIQSVFSEDSLSGVDTVSISKAEESQPESLTHLVGFEPDRSVPNEVFRTANCCFEHSSCGGERMALLPPFLERSQTIPSYTPACWWEKISLDSGKVDVIDGPNQAHPPVPDNSVQQPGGNTEADVTAPKDELTTEDKKSSAMAFTVDFGDAEKIQKGFRKMGIGDSLSKFAPKHRRNQSLTKVDENKKTKDDKGSEHKPTLPSVSASPNRKSSLDNADALFLKVKLNAKGPLRQVHRAEDEQHRSDPRLDSHTDRSEVNPDFQSNCRPEPPNEPESHPKVELACPEGVSESASYLIHKLLNSQKGGVHIDMVAPTEHYEVDSRSMLSPKETPASNGFAVEEAADKESTSEAGTYTIEKESLSPELDKARKDIDKVFGVEKTVCNKALAAVEKHSRESSPQSTRTPPPGTPNWIREWAAQVSQQHQRRMPDGYQLLPPSPTQRYVTSPIHNSSPASPSSRLAPARASSSQEYNGRPRRRLPMPPTNQLPFALNTARNIEHPQVGSSTKSKVVEKYIDSDTECFLRDTESALTAMQARMTKGMESRDSGGESEELASYPVVPDTSALRHDSFSVELQAKLKALEGGGKRNGSRRKSEQVASGSPRGRERSVLSDSGYENELFVADERKGYHSDTSSDFGDANIKEVVDGSPHAMRYGRAFSARRGQVGSDSHGAAEDKKPAVKVAAVTSASSKVKKAQVRSDVKPAPPNPAQFARADGGRYSLRVAKGTPQVENSHKTTSVKNKIPKREVKKAGSGGRSNSTLSSKEVEFQNWKRRKSYDPMKAAAEGRKREAARRGQPSSAQSATTNSTSSRTPSPPGSNCVLRSASFHGTDGMAQDVMQRSYTSEDETTLSLEDEMCSGLAPRMARSEVMGHAQARMSPLLAMSSVSDGVMDAVVHSPRFTRKASLDESLLEDNKVFPRNSLSSSSMRHRHKWEPVDTLMVATIHTSSHKLKDKLAEMVQKLRPTQHSDRLQHGSYVESGAAVGDAVASLEDLDQATCSPIRSPSKDLSRTLKNMKKIEQAIMLLDKVMFEEEDVPTAEQLGERAWKELHGGNYY